MLLLCGNGGTGKSTIINELVKSLDQAELSYVVKTLGEPDALNPTDSVVCAIDFIKWFESFKEDVVIIDSLRLFASLRGSLGKGGVNKNMSNYLTFLEQCALRAGKSFICTFNPLDDDENVGGYTNIIKSSVGSFIMLDDMSSNPNFQKVHKTTSVGYPGGAVLYSTRYAQDRSLKTLRSAEVVKTIMNLIRTDLEFIQSAKINISIRAILTTILFDVTPNKFNEALKYIEGSKPIVDNTGSDVSVITSAMTNFTDIFNSNDSDEDDFENFKLKGDNNDK